jgi:hypothetical protein
LEDAHSRIRSLETLLTEKGEQVLRLRERMTEAEEGYLRTIEERDAKVKEWMEQHRKASSRATMFMQVRTFKGLKYCMIKIRQKVKEVTEQHRKASSRATMFMQVRKGELLLKSCVHIC